MSDDDVTPFEDLIQRDPTVCNNCFRRTHDAVVVELTRRAFPITYHVWDARRDRTEHAHHDRLTFGLTRSCVCGSIDRHTKQRPLSFDKTIDRAQHLAETLDEKGVDYDRDRFFATVKERKRQPEHANREDSHVFAPAVERAITATTAAPPTP